MSRHHPLFGEVPIVPGPGAGGGPGRLWVYDPDFRPPLPPGAVRGDPRKQLFCCDVPSYFYVDLARTCRDCGAEFVFSAREQRHWYEVLGLRLDARAVRCLPCRRAWRRDRGISRALSDASRALAEGPLHAPAVLAYARAAVAHAERFGHAPLDAALAALRALLRSDPGAAEALLWEGRCQEAAGRAARAAAAYRRLLAAGAGLPVRLRRDAATRLALLSGNPAPA
ncbi:MAG: zinc-ribbon domain-containing protein [Thermoanaerobaculia bacterium]